MRRLIAAIAAFTAALTIGGSAAVKAAAPATPVPVGSLIFGDEFNGPGGSDPSSSLWAAKSYTAASGTHFSGWSNIAEDGSGNIVITADKSGSTWYSGFLSGKVGYSGARYVEARALVPCSYGTWAAPVWEWAYPYGSGGLEDDVNELLGKDPSGDYHTTVHNWTVSPQKQNSLTVSTGLSLCNAWHVYGAAVYSDHIDYYVDNTKVSSITAASVGLSSFTGYEDVLNIDLNMGGWGGKIGSEILVLMRVDYVHVYQLS